MSSNPLTYALKGDHRESEGPNAQPNNVPLSPDLHRPCDAEFRKSLPIGDHIGAWAFVV